MPAVLLCGVQSFGAGAIAVLHSILDVPTRPPGKSFCCLGIIQACPTNETKERQPLRALHKNVRGEGMYICSAKVP